MPNFRDDKTTEGAAAAIEVDVLAAEIGEVYFIEKEAKEEKERLKNGLFQAITDSFEAEGLAQKTVQISADIVASEANEYALRYNPGRRLVENEPDWDPSDRKVLLEEDPNFKLDSIVVEIEGGVSDHKDPKKVHSGYKITKEVRSGSAMVDEVRMQNVEPGLFEAVMIPRGYKWIADMLYELEVEPDEVDQRVKDYVPDGWPYELREDLSEEDQLAIQPYTYEGPKSLALIVKYAKKTDF